MTARGRCDMSISMDADLQDDMDAMDRFIEKYREGCDVVYGVRNRRDTDTAFKRGTALMFYRLMKALGVDITYNHADYRLMSARGAGGAFAVWRGQSVPARAGAPGRLSKRCGDLRPQ